MTGASHWDVIELGHGVFFFFSKKTFFSYNFSIYIIYLRYVVTFYSTEN